MFVLFSYFGQWAISLEPVTLHVGYWVGAVEASEVMAPTDGPANSVPMSLGVLVQQHQLTQLLKQYWDIFSQDDDDIRQTPVLEHTIKTQGLPEGLNYHRQNPTVRREEAKRVQQMLDSGIIRPSSSP